MKKENKRELTLKQIEKRRKACKLGILICVYIILIAIIFVISVKFTHIIPYEQAVLFYFLLGLCILLIVMVLNRLDERLKEQINLKMEQMRINLIKKLAKEEGNLKDFVSIKDEDFITDILSKSIEKIVKDKVYGADDLVVRIQLDDNTWISSVHISKRDLVSILDENTKKEILDYLVTNIEIQNLEKEKKEIIISGPGYVWSKEQATDDDLLRMLGLKE